MKKAILYCRVASDTQANQCGLDVQEETLRSYCEQNNIEVISVYREGFSGKNFDEFNKLLKYIREKQGEVNLLLITRWDRLGRNQNESIQMIHGLEELGVEPVSIEQPLDMSIPKSKLMLALYLAVPEVDNLRRGRNTKGGVIQAAQAGRWARQAVSGYRIEMDEDDKPIIVPDENAELIVYAFAEILSRAKDS